MRRIASRATIPRWLCNVHVAHVDRYLFSFIFTSPGVRSKWRHFYPIPIHFGVSSLVHQEHTQTHNGGEILSFPENWNLIFFEYLFRANDNKLVCVDIVCAKCKQTIDWRFMHTYTHMHTYSGSGILMSMCVFQCIYAMYVCEWVSVGCKLSSVVGEEVEEACDWPDAIMHMRKITVCFIEFFPFALRLPHHSKSSSGLKGARATHTHVPLQSYGDGWISHWMEFWVKQFSRRRNHLEISFLCRKKNVTTNWWQFACSKLSIVINTARITMSALLFGDDVTQWRRL